MATNPTPDHLFERGGTEVLSVEQISNANWLAANVILNGPATDALKKMPAGLARVVCDLCGPLQRATTAGETGDEVRSSDEAAGGRGAGDGRLGGPVRRELAHDGN